MQVMQHFDEHVVQDLEFDLIRLMLHDYCLSATARMRAGKLTPMCELNAVVKALEETEELRRIRTEEHGFPALEFSELDKEIQTLRIRDSVLSEESFRSIAAANALVNSMIHFFDTKEATYPHLWSQFKGIDYNTEITEEINTVFDARGKVKDDASPALFKIRQAMLSLRRKINRNFEKELKALGDQGFLADTREGFVNDRRVLAVMSTHKRKISGVTMGSSKTGTIAFIEPRSNVPLNFEYESLKDDEQREIFQILKALTQVIRRHLPLMEAYQRLLPELDFINARTRLALEMDGQMPGMSKDPEVALLKAYHPVLLLTNKRSAATTHPQNIRLDREQRMLVISGPNAGGKSVTLKTVGLLQVMAQSGLLIPADSGSRLGLFHSVLTDIGDNQSIENQLSTYSYRLQRMKHFLDVANRRSLLLLDEFGTGSDPELGGAMAEVFFEELYKKKAFGVVTTHYANIKLKAAELQHAFNGSMLFDKDSLAPMYKLDIGQPGSSFTFEVAEINGIPRNLIEAAKSRLDHKKVKLDALIADLQKEKSQYGKLNEKAVRAELEARKAEQASIAERAKLEEKLKAQQELMESQNHYITRGKRMSTLIDRFELKAKSPNNKVLLEELKKYLTVEKTKIEEAARAEKLKQQAAARKNPKKIKPQHELIKVGSTVRLSKGGKQRGTVMELEGTRAVVAFGMFRTKVDLRELVFVQ